ncbi:MAG: peptide deformylase [Candidatus Omnitrophica bacterium]|nr:peptide deformylase [Candidatus Omnitrophota bacterium]
MAVLPIRKFPDPLLKSPTRNVLKLDDQIKRLIQAMIATMRHYPHCVGLAAPQVGSEYRIAVMDVSGHPKAEKPHGLLVLINPIVMEYGPREKVGREGCMSVPDFTGNVPRAMKLRLRAFDQTGSPQDWTLRGFEAVVAQHEIDHLDGLLFLDRVERVGSDVFRRKTYR